MGSDQHYFALIKDDLCMQQRPFGSNTSLQHNMGSASTTKERLLDHKSGTGATTSHQHNNKDITMKVYQ
jgi:hypothetical protein